MTPFSSSSPSMRTNVTSPGVTTFNSHCYLPPPELSPLLDKNDDCWTNMYMAKALPVIDEEQEHASSPLARSSRSSRRLTIRKSETFECLTDLLLPHDGEQEEHHHHDEAEEAQEMAQQHHQQRDDTITTSINDDDNESWGHFAQSSSSAPTTETAITAVPPRYYSGFNCCGPYKQQEKQPKKKRMRAFVPQKRHHHLSCKTSSSRSSSSIGSSSTFHYASKNKCNQINTSSHHQLFSVTLAPTAFERSSGNRVSRMPLSPRSLPAGNHY